MPDDLDEQIRENAVGWLIFHQDVEPYRLTGMRSLVIGQLVEKREKSLGHRCDRSHN
ncbi:hypothetical protein SH139x_002086 [Planctomycetaceae bacterium SH139]